MQNEIPTLSWMCGVPGSGKTTMAERLASIGWIHIKRDAIREKYGEYTPLKEMQVVAEIEAQAKGHLLNGQSVVIDNVNNEVWQRIRYSSWGKDLWDLCALKTRKLCLYVPCELEVALERRKEKMAKEPQLEKFIRKQAAEFVVPTVSEGFHVYVIDAKTTPVLEVAHGPIRPFEYKDLRG